MALFDVLTPEELKYWDTQEEIEKQKARDEANRLRQLSREERAGRGTGGLRSGVFGAEQGRLGEASLKNLAQIGQSIYGQKTQRAIQITGENKATQEKTEIGIYGRVLTPQERVTIQEVRDTGERKTYNIDIPETLAEKTAREKKEAGETYTSQLEQTTDVQKELRDEQTEITNFDRVLTPEERQIRKDTPWNLPTKSDLAEEMKLYGKYLTPDKREQIATSKKTSDEVRYEVDWWGSFSEDWGGWLLSAGLIVGGAVLTAVGAGVVGVPLATAGVATAKNVLEENEAK